jgi:sugar transferase EpsL
LDVAVAAVALVLVAPLLVVLAILVGWKIGWPVLFRQPRAGLGGTPFLLCKFRTMADRRDPRGDLLPDRERMTSLGRILRATSLDELPTLVNVLSGAMSLVGPRPQHVRYLPRYSPRQARRHEVRPGITGWAQVGGRNRLSWEERFELDVWYVDHVSLWLDLMILLRTVWQVLRREGASPLREATMPEFQGAHAESDRVRH